MLNVNALQKTLSAMSLPEIQKYASMHKDDPYVVSMALSVANMKKEAMTAQQGQAGTQHQPKVVDQDIEGIAPHAPVQAPAPAMGAAQLPENAGIGQLPAPNMQGMADGGIVAFDDGGRVGKDIWDPLTGEWITEDDGSSSGLGSWLAEKTNWKKGLNIDPAGGLRAPVPKPSEGSKKLNADRDAAMAQVNDTPYTRGAMQDDPRLAGYKLPAGITSDSVALNKTAPTADGGGRTLPGNTAGAGGAGAGAAPQAGLGSFMQYLKDNKPAGPEDMDKFMARREAYLGENPTKKQMERLDKQEAAALADKEESKAMAIIKAGLGMMGSRSPYAMQGISEGATAGLESFISDQKEAKKLKMERDKMRDAVENAAFAYKKGDLDAYEKYAQDAKNAQNTYAAHGLAALGSVTGAQIHAGATLGAANISAGATKEYLNAIRGGSLIEATRKSIAKEVEDANKASYNQMTEAQKTALFNQKWQAALQANPVLAQLSGGATGGGGAPGLSAADAALVNKYTQ